MYNATNDGTKIFGRTVTISTLALIHHLPLPDAYHKGVLEGANDLAASSGNDDDEFYWMTGFFITSESCVHCQLSRMDKANHFANKTLRGYKIGWTSYHWPTHEDDGN